MIISIEADTASQMKTKMKALFADLFGEEIHPVVEVTKEIVTEVAPMAVAPSSKRGPKAKPKEAVVTEVVVPIDPTGEIKATKEDCLLILQKVNGARSINVAKQVLAKFGCARLSDLKPENYVPFIAECNTVLS